MAQLNDLWIRAKDGDKKAEEQVFRKLRVRLTLLARLRVPEEDVEDIVQDTCLTISRKYKSLAEPFRFDAWVHEILRNKVRNYYRARGRSADLRWDLRDYDQLVIPHNAQHNPELMRTLVRCARKLISTNRKYARVLNLSQQGFKTSEICERMRVTRNNLYVMLNRSRNFLLNCILGDRSSDGE
jgi:RNA polymerase sigma factor (sigma-70 family)